jgi:ketosteroid isomerase-like protein
VKLDGHTKSLWQCGTTCLAVSDAEQILRDAYKAFNERNLDSAIELMHEDVDWPNAWEGGRVRGRKAVREYWQRQFASISSQVEPERFTADSDGSVVVDVHQVVHDAEGGQLLTDSRIQHRYRLDGDLIVRMDVEESGG